MQFSLVGLLIICGKIQFEHTRGSNQFRIIIGLHLSILSLQALTSNCYKFGLNGVKGFNMHCKTCNELMITLPCCKFPITTVHMGTIYKCLHIHDLIFYSYKNHSTWNILMPLLNINVPTHSPLTVTGTAHVLLRFLSFNPRTHSYM